MTTRSGIKLACFSGNLQNISPTSSSHHFKASSKTLTSKPSKKPSSTPTSSPMCDYLKTYFSSEAPNKPTTVPPSWTKLSKELTPKPSLRATPFPSSTLNPAKELSPHKIIIIICLMGNLTTHTQIRKLRLKVISYK